MKRNRDVLELRGNPIMSQVAALQSAVNQYNQINSVMPQLQAEVSTLQWLYTVMNKGESQLMAMNQNMPIRVKDGSIELAGPGEEGVSAPINYAQINAIASNPNHPQHSIVSSVIQHLQMNDTRTEKSSRRTIILPDTSGSEHGSVLMVPDDM